LCRNRNITVRDSRQNLPDKGRLVHSPKIRTVALPCRGIEPPLLPLAAATSCLPPVSYVTIPPAIGPPVLKRDSSLPLRASSTSRLPSKSPVSSTLPPVEVTAAYIG